jgi:four helix bundle protein
MKDEGGKMKEADIGRSGLAERTKRFALEIIRTYSKLPKTTVAQVLGKQLLRSGTSVGAHYREARRAKSAADFVSKIEGGLQELDESGYWIELLMEVNVADCHSLEYLRSEVEELISIFVTVAKSAKTKLQKT